MIGPLLAAIVAIVEPPVEVAPADLARRGDLVGREVVVDGRIAYFQSHEGVFDELYLKKTPTPFRLPADLQSRHSPEGATARVQGVVKKENGAIVVEVATLKMLPGDSERLKQGVALLAPNDADGRAAWARWARYRAQEYGEPALAERSRELDAEAIRIESGRAGAETPAGALRLARKARDLGVPEPEPSAIAHRAFRLRLAEARTSADFEAVRGEIENFLPDSKNPAPDADLAAWDDAYRADPASAYRLAPESARVALDRRLWADAEAGALDRQAAERPDSALSIGDSARSRLPDRPDFADRIEAKALDRAIDDEHLPGLRRDDVDTLARRLVARGQADRAQALKRRWLEDQRRRKLRPGDAEGRVLLAGQFEAILGDRASAVSLLKEAWAIDPQSKVTADAFRRLGYRKVEDDWEPASPVAAPPAPRPDPDAPKAPPGPEELSGDSLRNLTRQEVRGRLGEPSRVARSVTLAGVLEQWSYPGTRRTQFVNFFFRPGMPQPIVQRSYSIPTP